MTSSTLDYASMLNRLVRFLFFCLSTAPNTPNNFPRLCFALKSRFGGRTKRQTFLASAIQWIHTRLAPAMSFGTCTTLQGTPQFWRLVLDVAPRLAGGFEQRKRVKPNGRLRVCHGFADLQVPFSPLQGAREERRCTVCAISYADAMPCLQSRPRTHFLGELDTLTGGSEGLSNQLSKLAEGFFCCCDPMAVVRHALAL